MMTGCLLERYDTEMCDGRGERSCGSGGTNRTVNDDGGLFPGHV